MAKDLNPAALPDFRMFDIAKGVLVGVRRCTVDEAFAELLACAEQHRVGVFALSRALVALRDRSEAVPDAEATMAARTAWGDLLLNPAGNA